MVTIIIILVTAAVSILCFPGSWMFPLICRPDIFIHFLSQLGL